MEKMTFDDFTFSLDICLYNKVVKSSALSLETIPRKKFENSFEIAIQISRIFSRNFELLFFVKCQLQRTILHYPNSWGEISIFLNFRQISSCVNSFYFHYFTSYQNLKILFPRHSHLTKFNWVWHLWTSW